MANISGILQPSDQPGSTFTLAATTASPVKTFYANAILRVAIGATAGAAAGATVTFGQVNPSLLGGTGRAPTTPSATNGFFINANAVGQDFWLGPNSDSVQFFNNTAASITISIQTMQP